MSDVILEVIAVIGTVGTLWGLYLHFSGRKEKRPVYVVSSTSLIEAPKGRPDELTILFAGKEQERVTRVRVALWNAGRETIRDDDIPSHGDRLAIVVSQGVEILDAWVGRTSNDACNINTDYRMGEAKFKRQVPFHFDYLDCNDGALFHIIHNGTLNTPVTISGNIKGAGFTRLMQPSYLLPQGIVPNRHVEALLMALACTLILCCVTVAGALHERTFVYPRSYGYIAIAIAGVLTIVVLTIIRRSRRTYVPHFLRKEAP